MEKKNQRISKAQKNKLVAYMSDNLEFARGQFGGINSNIKYKQQWESLALDLNSLGGSDKSIDQWKKCWIDLKSAVKKQVNARRIIMNKTGGGSYYDVPRDLNSFEEQILQIITTDAVDGDGSTPESSVSANESISSLDVLDVEDNFVPPKKRRNTSQSNLSVTTSKYKDAIEESKKKCIPNYWRKSMLYQNKMIRF